MEQLKWWNGCEAWERPQQWSRPERRLGHKRPPLELALAPDPVVVAVDDVGSGARVRTSSMRSVGLAIYVGEGTECPYAGQQSDD